MQKYLILDSYYGELYAALYEPLQNKTVPTVQELTEWLKEDPTDSIAYVMPDFVCGDFAVTLSFHAKLKEWDLGVVAVLGRTSNGSEFNHAFNAIICQEGLVYVETQTDDVWWIGNHEEIAPGSWYEHPGSGEIYVKEYIIVLLYN